MLRSSAARPTPPLSLLPPPHAQVLGDMQHPAALAEARQEIAILRACRDVNIVQFVVGACAPPCASVLLHMPACL